MTMQGATVNRRAAAARRIAGSAASYLVLCVLVLFFLFPLFVMLAISILPDSEVNTQVLFSRQGIINFGTYLSILSGGSRYLMYLKNSLLVGLIVGIGIPLVSSLCAYGFCKLEFKGRDLMFGIVLSTMMIPAVVTIIPLYTIYARLGWVDTLLPMWVPSLFGGGAVNIFLMRQFMRGIPNDLLSAAKLDGANSLVIFVRVMLPLCVPVFLYVGVTSFMGSWNDFMTPYTYLNRSSDSITLALGIYFDYGPQSTHFANVAMAAGVIMILPCAVLFFVFQRYLMEGVASTGLKD